MSTRIDPNQAATEEEPPAHDSERVLLLDRAVRALAQHVEALRQRSGGQPTTFFTQWTDWRSGWTRFAAQRTASSQTSMSAEDRARLRAYVAQYDAIRSSVLRALGVSSPPPGSGASTPPREDGWPRWVWASLLGAGVSVAFYALRERGS